MPHRIVFIPFVVMFAVACDQAPSGGLNPNDQDTGQVEGDDASTNGTDSGARADDSGTMNLDAGEIAADSGAGGMTRDSGGAAPDARGGDRCDELALCCDRLPTRQRAQCRDAAAQGDEQRCARLLQMCPPALPDGGEPEPPAGDGSVGPIPDSGQPVGRECSALQMCCANLQGADQQRCNSVVNRGQERTCRRARQTYCGGTGTSDSGIRPPTPDTGIRPPNGDGGIINPPGGDAGQAGNGCARLTMCCPMLPMQVQTNCNQTAQASIDSACLTFLGQAQSRGFCLGI